VFGFACRTSPELGWERETLRERIAISAPMLEVRQGNRNKRARIVGRSKDAISSSYGWRVSNLPNDLVDAASGQAMVGGEPNNVHGYGH